MQRDEPRARRPLRDYTKGRLSMQTNWQQFLQQQGAVWEGDHLAHFGNRAQELSNRDGDVLVSLHELAVIRAAGQDARKFLLSQFTNDVNLISPEKFQLNGYCSPKGRLLALMWVVQRNDEFLLILPQNILEPTLKRLRLFVLNAKVSLEDASSQWLVLGCAGPGAPAAIERLAGMTPEKPDSVASTNSMLVMRMPGITNRFIVLGGSDPLAEGSLAQAWRELARTQRAVTTEVWAGLEIESGVPHIVPATIDEFVPQMVNLEQLGGLSFTKGCYPGQEIVARTQYRGQIKRRMVLLHGSGESQPQPGEKLYAAGNMENAVGRVVRAAPRSSSDFSLLAVVENEKRAQPLHLAAAPHATLELMNLPYTVDTT